MDNKQYALMDWAAMEALVYSENDNPHSWLGGHVTKEGVLYNTYQPTASSVTLRIKDSGEKIEMDNVDNLGNYSALVQGDSVETYMLDIVYDDDSKASIYDPYAFDPVITEEDEDRFNKGIHYEIYEKLGAHYIKHGGVYGTYFAVWAPNAMRVSVVGNFNLWDGRRAPMRRLPNSGIFELFIPGVGEGELYKFEIKAKGGLTYLKADPYANYAELRPDTASVVAKLNYKWGDNAWVKSRAKTDHKKERMSIYEVHLGSWRRRGVKENDFYNYRELAVLLADYVKEMGYTHIELMPIMEHPFDGSWGYQVTGYYAVTSRYGTPQDFMYFVDYMHQQGIGVILDWVPAHFPRDTFALSNFDGTCLYEHADPRMGAHPHWGTLIYNFGRPQVSNFLISNALFWVDKYHIDGIRMDAVASMLYLDYGRNNGEWIPNKYGGKENLDAIELLKHLGSIFAKKAAGSVLIAEESTAWPKVTGKVEDDGLGFDFKWNMGWMNDFTNYMKLDPLYRKNSHGALTFGMMYAYSENFILVFSHDEVVHGKGSMLNKMPGDDWAKAANLRAAYGFMSGHPGKKLLFMGQEFAQPNEWNENESLNWELLDISEHKQMQEYCKALNKLAQEHPACYELDYSPEGFAWISCLDADHSIVSFVRKSETGDTLLFIYNFTPVEYEGFAQGVPFAGKFKEILNSDDTKFGGTGKVNTRVKNSKSVPVDGVDNSISITLPPLAMVVFSCTPNEEEKPKKRSVKTVKTEADAADEQPKSRRGRPAKTGTAPVAAEGVTKAAEKAAKKTGRKRAKAAEDVAEKTEKPAEPVKEQQKKPAEPVAEQQKKPAEPVKEQPKKLAEPVAEQQKKVEEPAEEKPKKRRGRPAKKSKE